jgi:hypothetical protein
MKKPLIFAALLCGCLFASQVSASSYEPGFKFNGGRFVIHPTVNAGISWESNMGNSSTHEESGFLWRVQPALALQYNAKRTTLGMNMFYTMERPFDDGNGGDNDSYGINFSLLQKLTERTRLTVMGSYTRSEDEQFYWNDDPYRPGSVDKDESENYNFNVALGHTAKKWHSSIGAGWRRTRQLDNSDQVSDAFNVNGLLGRAIGAHTYWDFSLGATIDRPDDGDDSISYSLMTGVSGEASERTSYSALVGITMYDYNGYNDDTAYGPAYNISGAYRLSRKVTLSLAASSRYESEYAGYGASRHRYVFNHTLTAAANFQWTDVFSSRLDLRGTFEQHEDTGSGYGDADRTYIQVGASSYYKFNQFVTMYGRLSYSMDEYDSDSSEKDNVRFELGFSFRF